MRTPNRNWALSWAMAAAIAVTACQTPRETAQHNPDPAHNSSNALDWAGTYQGTLPCADCPGIQTTLTLNADGSYSLNSNYLERGEPATTVNGQFTWDMTGNQLTLAEDGRKFQVGENQLTQLDIDGNPITGNLADHYRLQKLDDALVGKYWKLVEVNGQPVQPGSTQKEPFIRLTAVSNRVEGSGGCNGVGGTYTLASPNRIRFSEMMGTMMACDNMDIERNMLQALQSADSYHVANDTLQLFRARMAPLAKFTTQDRQ